MLDEGSEASNPGSLRPRHHPPQLYPRHGIDHDSKPLLSSPGIRLPACPLDSWEKVCNAVESVVAWGLEQRKLESIRAIGVDEIQYAKGHKYLTLVYQIDQGITRLLWVGKERTVESFQGFFTMLGETLASQIEFVCSDMWQPYLDVIRQKCSQALHILDRFHMVAKMNKALDDARRRSTPDLQGWPSAAEKIPMVSAEAQREPHIPAEDTPPRSAALQPPDRQGLSPQRRFSAILGIQLPHLGRHVLGLLVFSDHALAHRADERRSPAPCASTER
jgi:hypothetical protein